MCKVQSDFKGENGDNLLVETGYCNVNEILSAMNFLTRSLQNQRSEVTQPTTQEDEVDVDNHDALEEESEKSSGQYLGLICDESLTCRRLNLNPEHFCSFIFIPYFV
jgi:hypothetical protein